jgi:hypothetical protein
MIRVKPTYIDSNAWYRLRADKRKVRVHRGTTTEDRESLIKIFFTFIIHTQFYVYIILQTVLMHPQKTPI